MTLAQLWHLLRRHWRSTLASALAVGLVCGIAASFAPKHYTARAEIYVSAADPRSMADLNQATQYIAREIKSYRHLITSDDVLKEVIAAERLDRSVGALASDMRVVIPPESALLDIDVSDPDPHRAAAIANRAAAVLIDQLKDEKLVRLTVVGAAVPPTAPSFPTTTQALWLALVAAVVACGSTLTVHLIRGLRVRHVEDLTALAAGLPVLQQPTDPTEALLDAWGYVERAFPADMVTVAPLTERADVWAFAQSWARAWVQAGERVLLVDADLRASTGRHDPQTVGLVERLGADPIDVGSERLVMIGAGSLAPNPAALLTSGAVADTIISLAPYFDRVLICSVPPSHDGFAALADRTDGVLGVAALDRSWGADVANQIERASHLPKAPMFGLIVRSNA